MKSVMSIECVLKLVIEFNFDFYRLFWLNQTGLNALMYAKHLHEFQFVKDYANNDTATTNYCASFCTNYCASFCLPF